MSRHSAERSPYPASEAASRWLLRQAHIRIMDQPAKQPSSRELRGQMRVEIALEPRPCALDVILVGSVINEQMCRGYFDMGAGILLS